MSLPEKPNNTQIFLALNSRVIVLGASGWIGLKLVGYLLYSTECIVECWVRSETAAASVRKLCADERRLQIRCSENLFDLKVSPDAQVVIHGASPTNHWDAPGTIDMNVRLTWHLLDNLLGRSEPARLVYLSSLLIRGDSPTPFSEHDLNTGQSFITPYAQSKFLAETTIQTTYVRAVDTVILRLGSVLWSRSGGDLPRKDWLCQSIQLWRSGHLPILPLPENHRFYPVPIDDLCDLVGYTIGAPASPSVVHLPCDAGPTLGSVFDLLARKTGQPKPQFCASDSDQWGDYLNSLPASVLKRRVTALFPIPAKGAKLSMVDSEQSRRWTERSGLLAVPLTEQYWLNAL